MKTDIQIAQEAKMDHIKNIAAKAGIAEDELVERAAKGGVKVYGLSGALISPDPGIFASTVLLGYGRLSLEEIQEGAERLKSCWK